MCWGVVNIHSFVLHLYRLHGLVPGVWVIIGSSLDQRSISQIFVSRLYAISGGWLNILVTSVRACGRLVLFSE